MFKLLWIIVLGLLPFVSMAETVEEKTIKMWENQLNNCQTYQMETNERIKSYTDEEIRKAQETIAANNVCYKFVFRELLQDYYGRNSQQARSISNQIIDEINDEYQAIYSKHKYCQSGCDNFLLVKPNGWASLDFWDYLFKILLFLNMSEKKEPYTPFVIRYFMDSGEYGVIGNCQKQYFEQMCLTDNEECWKTNQNMLDGVQECFLEHLTDLIILNYDKKNVDAKQISQELWNRLYNRSAIIFNYSMYSDKLTPLQKELNTTTAALTDLMGHIQHIEEVTKTHGHKKNKNVNLDKFINPVFYERFDIVQRVPFAQTMFLTPTSISCYKRNAPDDCDFWDDCAEHDYSQNLCSYGDCQLIDQTEKRLLYSCIDEDAAGRMRPFYYVIDILDKYPGHIEGDWYEAILYPFEEEITIDKNISMFAPYITSFRTFIPINKPIDDVFD